MKSYLQILRESRLKKEEVESIDELSKATLGSYAKKAKDDLGNRESQITKNRYVDPAGVSDPTKHNNKLLMKRANRRDSINLAIDKITKEEAELAEKKDMSKGDIAALAGHKGKVDAADFKTLRNKEHLKKEEAEQIDELSKKTLGSYVKKASYDAAGKAAEYGHDGSGKNFSKTMDRLRNIKKATDRLTKEEAEQIDELSKKTLGSYVKKANRDTYLAGKFSDTDKEARAAGRKRKAGVAMAVDKLTKEEVEALDEVSGAKLGSYMVKARKNHDSSMEKRNDAIDAGDKDTARKLGAVAQKRQKGLSKAIDKLNGSGFAKVHATEEVEQDPMIAQLADFISREAKKK